MGQNCSAVHPAQMDVKANGKTPFIHSESYHGGPLIRKPDGTIMSLQPLDREIHRMPYYNPTDGFIEYEIQPNPGNAPTKLTGTKHVQEIAEVSTLQFYNPTEGFYDYQKTPIDQEAPPLHTDRFKVEIITDTKPDSSQVEPHQALANHIVHKSSTFTVLKCDTSRGLCSVPMLESSKREFSENQELINSNHCEIESQSSLSINHFDKISPIEEEFDITPVSERRKLFEMPNSNVSNIPIPSPTNPSTNMWVAKTHHLGKSTTYDWTKRTDPTAAYAGQSRSEIVVNPTLDNSSEVDVEAIIEPVSERIQKLKAISSESLSSTSPIPNPEFPTVKVLISSAEELITSTKPATIAQRRSTDSEKAPKSILLTGKSKSPFNTGVVAELHLRNVSPSEKRKVQFNGLDITTSIPILNGKEKTSRNPNVFDSKRSTSLSVSSSNNTKWDRNASDLDKVSRTRDQSLSKSSFSGTKSQENEVKTAQISRGQERIAQTSTLKSAVKIIQKSKSKGKLDIVHTRKPLEICPVSSKSAVVQTRLLLPSEEIVEITLFMEEPYNPGDLLYVKPENSRENVAKFCQIYEISSLDDEFVISGVEDELLQKPLTFDEFLTGEIDLSAPPTLELMQRLWVETELPYQLHSVLESDDTFDKWLATEKPDIFTVINCLMDHSVPLPPIEFFFTFWPRISSRPYQITSIEPGVITFNLKPIRIADRFGLTSNYLKSLRPKDHVKAEIRPHFDSVKLPISAKTPIVIISSGFGITSLRWMWELRKKNNHGGSISLIYNVKDPISVLYGNELTMRNTDGTISELLLFYGDHSDVVRQFRWDMSITRLIKRKLQANAHLYISGPIGFLENVKAWLTKVLEIPNLSSQDWYHESSSDI